MAGALRETICACLPLALLAIAGMSLAGSLIYYGLGGLQ